MLARNFQDFLPGAIGQGENVSGLRTGAETAGGLANGSLQCLNLQYLFDPVRVDGCVGPGYNYRYKRVMNSTLNYSICQY